MRSIGSSSVKERTPGSDFGRRLHPATKTFQALRIAVNNEFAVLENLLRGGQVDGGIVAVTSLWADERIYYPLHVKPYTPAERLP